MSAEAVIVSTARTPLAKSFRGAFNMSHGAHLGGVAVRAALLVDGMPFGPVPDSALTRKFQPCCGCAKPCVTACTPGAVDGIGGRDPTR